MPSLYEYVEAMDNEDLIEIVVELLEGKGFDTNIDRDIPDSPVYTDGDPVVICIYDMNKSCRWLWYCLAHEGICPGNIT